MSLTIYRDGQFVPDTQAGISPFDRGFLYGDGLFETLRCYDGKFFRAERHGARLKAGLDALGITLPASARDLQWVLRELVAWNNVANGVARIVVTRGQGEFGLLGQQAQQPLVLAACWSQP